MTTKEENKYFLPCVKCPFCHEVVEAEVVEKNGIKKMSCPHCKASAEYKIEETQK